MLVSKHDRLRQVCQLDNSLTSLVQAQPADSACAKCIEDMETNLSKMDPKYHPIAVSCPKHENCGPGGDKDCDCWTRAMEADPDDCQEVAFIIGRAARPCNDVCAQGVAKGGATSGPPGAAAMP
jgi:hypothetical protein